MPALSATPSLAQNAHTVNAVVRRNVTAVISREHAGSLSVCRAGDVVALHVGTAAGTRILYVSEREFVTKARGARDHNGNTFRSLAALVPASSLRSEELNTPVAEPVTHAGRSMPSAQLQAYRAALDHFLLHGGSKSAAFRTQDLPAHLYSAFCAWTLKPAQRDYAAAFRAPVRKPSGGL